MSENRIALRYPVSVPGRYRLGRGVPRDVMVLDLSEGGCRFFDKFGTLREGATLTFRIGSIGPIPAVVAWSTGQEVGVNFENDLYGPVFEHIRDQLNGGNRSAAMG